MQIKKSIRILHLWLGLASGLLVFIIAITGCLYVFKEEIEDITQKYRYVKPEKKEFLSPTTLIAIAQKELPGKKVHAVMYSGKSKAAKVIYYSDEEDYYYFVYTNPYTGEVLKVRDETNTFFSFILDGHYNLWLPQKTGKLIVASSTLVFVVMLITGIVLWFPKNKAAAKQRFTIKWSAKWRRKNFDLHSVVGFYVSWVAIVLAITGLVWGFEWFNKIYYTSISGGKKFEEYQSPLSDTSAGKYDNTAAINIVWMKLRNEYGDEANMEVHTPEDSVSALAANVNPDPGTYWQTDYRYYDQYTLKELSVKHMWGRFKETSRSDKLMRMNYDIHVGAIFGLPGKILAFFISLFIASLPITGILLWWGRKNKKKDTPPAQ